MNNISIVWYYLTRVNECIEAGLEQWDKQERAITKYKRPTHGLLCECRKCVPGFRTYGKRLRAE